ncbi:uncharacterized protein MKZ38_003222 [Zalerion maritima]|uniref:Uncharacterized protein n=1 Tax=Zalerion maritima TaxID=339359 RepID=A0AAD5WW93_9PEZI|nr:uncharacterized protein MKZ38_003222 [Zalerion maritima]
MDALKNITKTVPTWLTRLDDLSDQIDKRQLELAEFAEKQTAPRSIRNRGSTESLKPKDDADDHPMTPMTPVKDTQFPPQTQNGSNPQRNSMDPPASPSSDPKTPAALQKQSHQVIVIAQARARAMVKRKMKTASLISNEETAPKYRSRSMVIIYYDSYVQSFFEELVKFVSASRNLLRKAKMAAKVAQIRKLAELEMPDDDSKESSDNKPGAPLLAADPATDGPEEPLPPLRYMSSRRMGPMTRTLGMSARSYGRGMGLGTVEEKPDVYDDLDKGLEYVQGMCEHGAHQFLRDGTCGEEIANIQSRLAETRDMAEKEMERLEREEPESLQPAPEEPPKTRAFKPLGMRKTKEKDDSQMTPQPSASPMTPASPEGTVSGPKELSLEVDDDEDNDEDEPPQLVYRSTRAMRTRRGPT